ncbi:MAG: hypothetical protein JWN72_2906 [Thermoleophilia bacterium]|nr:hypothetical protein [Thermoleophilia bacterium]
MSDVSNIGGVQAGAAAYAPIAIAPAANAGVPATGGQQPTVTNASVPTTYSGAPQPGATTGAQVTGGGAPGGTTQAQYANAAQGNQATAPSQQAGAATAAPKGPPGWNMAWAQKFLDAGLPAESVQQLTMTGAAGADEAQLQESLDQVVQAGDAEIKKFAAEHGEEYVDLKSAKKLKRSELLGIAMQANQGALKGQALKDAVSQARTKDDPFNMLKSFLPWSFIPAWGAVRVALSPLFGGHDPISGERIKLDFWNNGMAGWIDALGAVAGAVTISAYAKGVGNVIAGNAAIGSSEAAAAVAKAAGMENLTGVNKLLSFLPGTQQNRVISGLSTVKNLEAGVGKLAEGSIARQLGDQALKEIIAGDRNMWGATPQKLTLMGFQSNTRSTVMSRGKQMIESMFKGNKATLIADARGTGGATAAHVASAMVDSADAATRAKILASLPEAVQQKIAAGGVKNLDALLRGQVLGEASRDLAAANLIKAPTTTFQKVWGAIRPGAVEDSFKAIDMLNKGSVFETQGVMATFKGLGGGAKFGILGGIAAAAAGGIYFLGIKPQLQAKKDADAAAATAAAGGGGAAAGAGGAATAPGGAPTGQPDAEAQAYLKQFAALPPQQQLTELQSLNTAITQAQATPNQTPEQQAAVATAQQELQQMMAIVQQAQGGGQAVGAQQQAAA